jgi:negative regulator of sigma-B (phosphoserine phosphatase)
VTARRPAPQAVLDWAVAGGVRPGQARSGDSHVVLAESDGSVLLAAVDGLGHGDEAAAAAERATETLKSLPGASVINLARRCHEALHGTRGAVMTLVRISPHDETLTWLGVGNVEALLIRHASHLSPVRESVVMRGGVVGYQLPPLGATVHPVVPGDWIVLATDGIRPEFRDGPLSDDEPQRAADRIIATFRRPDDDALVLVARYRGVR